VLDALADKLPKVAELKAPADVLAAREARGRSSPARRSLVDVCPSGRRARAAWSLPMRAVRHLGRRL